MGEKGVQLAVLPELWSCGFDTPEMLLAHAEKTPQIIETLSRLAIRHRLIIAGSMPEKSGDRLYNSMVVIDKDGTVAGTYSTPERGVASRIRDGRGGASPRINPLLRMKIKRFSASISPPGMKQTLWIPRPLKPSWASRFTP